jgi:hypothetical protein
MSLLDEYFDLRSKVFDYFGYVEDYKAIPLEDCRSFYWRLYGTGPGLVRFAESKEQLDDPEQNYYEDEIYTQRFLPKWVYRGTEFTIVCADPHTDGNHFLRVFDNTKECSSESEESSHG